MNGDQSWYKHELRTVSVQKKFIEKTIDRLLEKIAEIKQRGGVVDDHTKQSLRAASNDATFLKRKMVELRNLIEEKS
ncbi:MAG: hypothetical protein CMA70_04355 [Euryarchaeota archaeon]|nr:hypothetical protein [Euryarchaeota archaeon]|tara:strand:+ start:418 stop:648 length:231 start_codon:yes stop_codon:yes gene_type:complete